MTLLVEVVAIAGHCIAPTVAPGGVLLLVAILVVVAVALVGRAIARTHDPRAVVRSILE